MSPPAGGGTLFVYGSLLSRTGLRQGPDVPTQGPPQMAAIGAAERGYCVRVAPEGPAKARVAAGLRPRTWPMGGVIRSPQDPVDSTAVEGLVLQLAEGGWQAIAARTGCAQILAGLEREAAGAGLRIEAFLWQLAMKVADFPRYQFQLYQQMRYWSPCYVPVPVHLGKAVAVCFIPPTLELGQVAPAMRIPALSVAEAIAELGANNDQWEYHLGCVLGGLHGVDVRDLLRGQPPEYRLTPEEVQEELEAATTAWFGGDAAAMERTLGQQHRRLARSGLADRGLAPP